MTWAREGIEFYTLCSIYGRDQCVRSRNVICREYSRWTLTICSCVSSCINPRHRLYLIGYQKRPWDWDLKPLWKENTFPSIMKIIRIIQIKCVFIFEDFRTIVQISAWFDCHRCKNLTESGSQSILFVLILSNSITFKVGYYIWKAAHSVFISFKMR